MQVKATKIFQHLRQIERYQIYTFMRYAKSQTQIINPMDIHSKRYCLSKLLCWQKSAPQALITIFESPLQIRMRWLLPRKGWVLVQIVNELGISHEMIYRHTYPVVR